MRYSDLITEAERVPTLDQLWRYSDEFTPEQNERARQAALADIEKIRERNKSIAQANKEKRAEFKLRNLADMGFDAPAFIKFSLDDLLVFFKANPKIAAEAVIDPATLTRENLFDQMVAQSKADGSKDPEFSNYLEVFLNPGPKTEAAYGAQIKELDKYWSDICQLGPKGKEKAIAHLKAQFAHAFNQ